VIALARRAVARWLPWTLRFALAMSLWLFVAPLLSAYLYLAWMARPSVILERASSWTSIWTDLVSGAVVATCIIVSFLSMMSFADFLRVEWQQRGLGPRNNMNNNGAAAAAQQHDPNINWVIDNGIWDHAQQQVLERNRGDQQQNDNNLRPVRGGWNEVLHANYSEDDSLDDIDELFNDDDDDDESWLADDDNDDEEEDEYMGTSEEEDDYDDDEVVDAVNLAAGVRRHHDERWVGRLDGEVIRHRENPFGAADPEQRAFVQAEMNRIMEEANRRRIMEEQPEQQQQQQNNPAPPADFNMDQEDPIDMDINIALDELLGVRGPLLVVMRNLLWLLAFNAVYLGIFAFVPRTVGMAMSSILFNTTMFASPPSLSEVNATLESIHLNSTANVTLINVWKAIEAESVLQNTAFRLHDVTIVLLGYLSLALAVIFFRFLWFLSQKVRFLRSAARRRRGGNVENEAARDAIDEIQQLVQQNFGPDGAAVFGDEPPGIAISLALGVALDAMMAIVKVGLLMFLKMFLLPIFLGIALDVATSSVLGNTLEGRVAFAGKDLFSFFLMNWVAGITFMLLVTVSVLQLREVCHPDLLAQMIRPQEPQPDLLGNLMHESVSTHTKRMMLSLIIYVFLMSMHVYLPLRYCMTTAFGDSLKSFLRLKFAFVLTPQLQIPLELLFFHLCMLALLEKYKNGLGGIQHHWLKFMSNVMGISDRMLPHNVGSFRLIGTRPVFQSFGKIDPFWFDMADRKKDRLALVTANLASFETTNGEVSADAKSLPNGERVIRDGSDFIRLPIRLPGRALRNRAGLIATKIGKYRLQRDPSNETDSAIQLWEEVPSEPLVRPPVGWDDLGAGGADVQGRWAWGSEKKSAIEYGVAARRPFFGKDQTWTEKASMSLKLLILAVLSWLVGTILLFVSVTTPLIVGRTIFYVLRVPERWIHDPLGFGLGFMVVFPLVRKLACAIVAHRGSQLQRLLAWIARFHAPPLHKAGVLLCTAMLWFGLAPLLLGFAYELAFVKSIDWFAATEPLVPRSETMSLTWSVGALLLYTWTDGCILGVFTRRYRVFVLEGHEDPVEENADNEEAPAWAGAGERRVMSPWQGKHGRMARFFDTWKAVITNWEWDKVDEVTLLRECAFPVIFELLWTLLYPLASLGVLIWQFPLVSGWTRAVVVRSVLAMMCCFEVSSVWKGQLLSWFESAHKTARNDLFLIGETLMDFSE